MRARTLVTLFSAFALFVPFAQVHADLPSYTYTAYEFGPDINGHVWNIWASAGSNVWNWSSNYVNGFLHYSFKVLDYSGAYCSGSCRVHIVWDKNPTAGFVSNDVVD